MDHKDFDSLQAGDRAKGKDSSMLRFLITVAFLTIGAVANYGFSRPEVSLIRRPFKVFPRIVGDWTVVDEQAIGQSSMAVLQVDDYMMRTYANREGETVGLYIGYFKTQREGKQIHSPRQCLSGGGWTPVEDSIYELSVKGHNPGTVPVNRYIMAKGDEKQLYLFWYQGRGRVYASEYLNKLYLLWDALTKRRTDGALVRLNMAITSDPEQTLATEAAFIRNFLPILPEHVPE